MINREASVAVRSPRLASPRLASRHVTLLSFFFAYNAKSMSSLRREADGISDGISIDTHYVSQAQRVRRST